MAIWRSRSGPIPPGRPNEIGLTLARSSLVTVVDRLAEHGGRDQPVDVLPAVDHPGQVRGIAELVLQRVGQHHQLDLRIVAVDKHLPLARDETAADRPGRLRLVGLPRAGSAG